MLVESIQFEQEQVIKITICLLCGNLYVVAFLLNHEFRLKICFWFLAFESLTFHSSKPFLPPAASCLCTCPLPYFIRATSLTVNLNLLRQARTDMFTWFRSALSLMKTDKAPTFGHALVKSRLNTSSLSICMVFVHGIIRSFHLNNPWKKVWRCACVGGKL